MGAIIIPLKRQCTCPSQKALTHRAAHGASAIWSPLSSVTFPCLPSISLLLTLTKTSVDIWDFSLLHWSFPLTACWLPLHGFPSFPSPSSWKRTIFTAGLSGSQSSFWVHFQIILGTWLKLQKREPHFFLATLVKSAFVNGPGKHLPFALQLF